MDTARAGAVGDRPRGRVAVSLQTGGREWQNYQFNQSNRDARVRLGPRTMVGSYGGAARGGEDRDITHVAEGRMTDSDEQLPGVRAPSPFRNSASRVASAPLVRIVLASSSPRRRELLVRAGIRFVVAVPSPDPPLPPGMCADLGCQLIARQKAVEVAARVEPGSFVVAADTVVVGPRGPLGKPGTPEAALRMLTELRGRRHTVLTGVCVLRAGTDVEALAVSRSLVKMRDFSDQDLITYVASGEPLDKAGAYAVQGAGGDLVEAVSGRVDTVFGLDAPLPLRLLAEPASPDPLPRAPVVPLSMTRRPPRPPLLPHATHFLS